MTNQRESRNETVDFVPPFPHRHAATPSPLKLLRLASTSYLSVWSDHDFSLPISSTRILRRQIVICNTPELVKQAFQDNHQDLQRKSPQMRHALEPLIGDGLFISDGDIWSARRRVVQPIVHSARVSGFAPIMVETINERLAQWMQLGDGAQIDALAEMAQLTAEIICRTIFGQNLGQAYADEIVGAFSDYQRQIDQVDLASLLGLPAWLPRPRGRAIRRAVGRISTVLDEIIDRFVTTRSADGETVIGGLLDARDQRGAPLSRDAIRNEAAVIFMAGHETTANTLAWAWYLLSQSPRVAARLHKEIDEVLDDRVPDFADVARLPYARAVIEETLRLYPPVPILAREATKALTLGDVDVSRGALVLVVPWLLHRNPSLWPDADRFRPERHLETTAAGGKPWSKYSYVPFSAGPRICPGLSFGITEAVLSLAILARDFAPLLVPGTDVQPVSRLTLRPGETLPMTLNRRERRK